MFGMTTEESLTTISMGITLVIAVIAAVADSRCQQEAQKRDRELADRADLRGLLDEAVVAFERSRDTFDDLIRRFYEYGKDLPDEPRDALAGAGGAMRALSARLSIRPDKNGAVASSFERAYREILETLHTVRPDDLDGASDNVVDEKLVEVELSREAIEEARAAFMIAAAKRVGAIRPALRR